MQDRPYTGAAAMTINMKGAATTTASGGLAKLIGNQHMHSISHKKFTPALGRAVSAGFSHQTNLKLQRCEVLITKFKRKLEEERRLLRMMKTMSASEIDTKNQLEKILRQCVDDVKAEIVKKRSENKSSYYARGKKGKMELREE